MSEIPWAGLVALVAMFLVPLLPDWVFAGRRTVKHWPRRHVCGDCAAPWTDGHRCQSEQADPPLRVELRRVAQQSLTVKE
jgi:hypothetical protein